MSPALDQGGQHTRVPRRHRAGERCAGTCRVVDLGRCGKKGATLVDAKQAPKGWTLPFKNDLAWTGTANASSSGSSRPILNREPLRRTRRSPRRIRLTSSSFSRRSNSTCGTGMTRNLIRTEEDLGPREGPHLPRRIPHRCQPRGPSGRPHLARRRVLGACAVCARNLRCALCEADHLGEGARDIYLVDLSDGSRKLVPRGSAAVRSCLPTPTRSRFSRTRIGISTIVQADRRAMHGSVGVAFHNEAHDTPSTPPAYGAAAGWMTAPRFLSMTNTISGGSLLHRGAHRQPDEQRRTWPQSHIPRGANRSGSALLQLCEPVAADRLQRTGQKLGFYAARRGNPEWKRASTKRGCSGSWPKQSRRTPSCTRERAMRNSPTCG